MNKKNILTTWEGRKKFGVLGIYYRRQLSRPRVRSSMWFFLSSIYAPTNFLKLPYVIIMASLATTITKQ